ncbi:MAG: hypothetical protein OSB41_12440 [Kiritimatiellae bacterium]|nr:hypothetical protein [Kiritimatiellia bacterium]
MTSTVHTAGFELLIWVVFIIFSIVAQAIKGMKKFKEGRPGQLSDDHSSPKPHLNPQQELQDFLKELSGSQTRVETPEPEAPERVVTPVSQPIPKPAPPPVPHTSRSAAPKRVVRVPEEVPETVHAGLAEVASVANYAGVANTAAVSTLEAAPTEDANYAIIDHEKARNTYFEELRMSVATELTGNKKIRKAVLLQEILSAPVSLRKTDPGIPSM